MRLRQFAIATLVVLGPAGTVVGPIPHASARPVANKSVGSGLASYANLPPHFEANRGQTDSRSSSLPAAAATRCS